MGKLPLFFILGLLLFDFLYNFVKALGDDPAVIGGYVASPVLGDKADAAVKAQPILTVKNRAFLCQNLRKPPGSVFLAAALQLFPFSGCLPAIAPVFSFSQYFQKLLYPFCHNDFHSLSAHRMKNRADTLALTVGG